MNEKELIEILEQFESDNQTQISEIIILGDNGAIRRLLLGEDERLKYIG